MRSLRAGRTSRVRMQEAPVIEEVEAPPAPPPLPNTLLALTVLTDDLTGCAEFYTIALVIDGQLDS